MRLSLALGKTVGELLDELTYTEYNLYMRYGMQQPLGVSEKLDALANRLFGLLHSANFDTNKYPYKPTEYIDWLKYEE